uniref:PNPLA domain-containing protein n=1 Tax=Ciona savignyi TaxID=51511 RepID=H2YVJ2_CIOSA
NGAKTICVEELQHSTRVRDIRIGQVHAEVQYGRLCVHRQLHRDILKNSRKEQISTRTEGLLTNNPTGVALNECSLLWPNSPIQCVVSVGTGRYEPTIGPTSEQFLSLKDKLLKVVDSATSVSEVHTVMYDLLPPYTYFRFNPYIKEPLLLDDFHPEKLDMLVEDAHEYIARNEHKFQACVDTLFGKKNTQNEITKNKWQIFV